MKKVLSTILLLLLVGYVLFAAITLTGRTEGQLCKGIQLEIQDSLKTGYMSTTDIAVLLAKKGLNPTGQLLDSVSLQAIESALETSPLIASCECYKTISGHVVVSVECRKPILRIITHAGESYYLDEEGEAIAISPRPYTCPSPPDTSPPPLPRRSCSPWHSSCRTTSCGTHR